MANSWLRLWHDMPNDPKWRTISRASGQSISVVIAVYLHVLVNASNATERGRTHAISSEDIASALDVKVEETDAILAAMQGRVLEGDLVSGWEARQPKREDGAADRARAWREAQKDAPTTNTKRNRTQPNAQERPDTDTDTEKKEQKQKVGKPPALTLPDWLPESTWADWHAFRNQRKGWTHKARELSLATLAKLRSVGHDPVGVIEQSIERGWTGLFELRPPSTQARAGPQLAAIGKTAQAIQALEDMKHGNRLGIGRDFNGHTETLAAIAGKHASG